MLHGKCRTAIWFVPALVLLGLLRSNAQSASEKDKPSLELGLAAKYNDGKQNHGANKLPDSFRFEFVNVSHDDVHMAEPLIECSDSRVGWVYIVLKFTPKGKAKDSGDGYGCVVDSLGTSESIMETVRTWKTIIPDHSLAGNVDFTQLPFKTGRPGKYEFWATYQPVSLSDLDQKLLKGLGFAYADKPLTSNHLVYEINN